ncbi:MAG: serine/threonine protein kinase, partial [Bradymonadaceae bacterium]
MRRPLSGWPDVSESGDPYLGKCIDGRYRLDRFLGAGTSGHVYRARAMRIHRSFAMKIVDTRRYGKPEYQKEMMRRFECEVEAMSRLRNPHVVNIYETLQLPEQTFALVMDYVEGVTLQEMLDRVGRIKARNAIEIVRQVANGLHEAHCAGIIHRDLKPENIMIEQLPASGFFARILDFGIAHVTEATGTTHGFRGTPLYASPEQCTEDPDLDQRSDIYSLGCVFFHCLTGRPPFPFAGALKVMECHVEEEAPSIFEARPGLKVSEKIDELLKKMLAKKAADRPQDLSAVIDAIDDVLAGRRHLEDSSIGLSGAPAASSPTSVGNETLTEMGAMDISRVTDLHVHLVADLTVPRAITEAMQTMILFSLGRQGNVCAVADDKNAIHVLSLQSDGFAETFTGARGRLTALHLDLARGSVYGADVDGTILGWNLGIRDQKPQTIGRLDASIMS